MTDKSNNAKESLAKIIENAKTKSYADMSATEQLTSSILQYDQGYAERDVFGVEAPVSALNIGPICCAAIYPTTLFLICS